MRLFKNKYKVKCPDGNVKTVYYDINDVFPLFLLDHDSSFNSSIENEIAGTVDIEIANKSKIKSILFIIDETSRSLMLQLRTAYVVYEMDPCSDDNNFKKVSDEIRNRHQNIIDMKVKVNALLELLKTPDVDNAVIINSFREIYDLAPTASLPHATQDEMKTAERDAQQMVEGGQ